MKYAKRKNATPYDANGHLKCDRCGNVVDPWPLLRPENCGAGKFVCIRAFGPVVVGWRALGFTMADAGYHQPPIRERFVIVRTSPQESPA